MTSPADDLLDQTQLASLLGLSRRHVSRLAAAGLLDDFEHRIPLYRQKRYSRALVERALQPALKSQPDSPQMSDPRA